MQHIPIERLYDFVTEALDLTEAEQAHIIRCSFCIECLDACAADKISAIRSRRPNRLFAHFWRETNRAR